MCVIVGMVRALEFCIKFPCDEMGKIELENESYTANTKPTMNTKFDQDIWLCLGCAMVGKSVTGLDKGYTFSNTQERLFFLLKSLKTELRLK